MYNKYIARNGRTVLAILAVVLLLGGALTTSLAWLTSAPGSVANTFTVGDVNITLTESNNAQTIEVIPGVTYVKDPIVTVKAGSEDCYVFVKVDVANNDLGNSKECLQFTYATGWQTLTSESDSNKVILYKTVDTSTADVTLPILQGDANVTNGANGVVSVNADFLKTDLDKISGKAPTLTFTAFAIQKQKTTADSFEASEAWALLETQYLSNNN